MTAVEELHRRARAGDVAARNEIVMGNLGLASAFGVASRRKYPTAPVEDLIGYARLGLIEAATDHDPKLGEFADTAFARMRHTVRQGVVAMSRWLADVPGSDGGRNHAARPSLSGDGLDTAPARLASPAFEAVERLPWQALSPAERGLVRAQYQLDSPSSSFVGERMRRRIKEAEAIHLRNEGIRKLRIASRDVAYFAAHAGSM